MFKTNLLWQDFIMKNCYEKMVQSLSTTETYKVLQYNCIKSITNYLTWLQVAYFVQRLKAITISTIIMILGYLLQELFVMALRASHI